MNKLWRIHRKEYYSDFRRRKIPMRATTRGNLEAVTLREIKTRHKGTDTYRLCTRGAQGRRTRSAWRAPGAWGQGPGRCRVVGTESQSRERTQRRGRRWRHRGPGSLSLENGEEGEMSTSRELYHHANARSATRTHPRARTPGSEDVGHRSSLSEVRRVHHGQRPV